jgi:hypothetical protein
MNELQMKNTLLVQNYVNQNQTWPTSPSLLQVYVYIPGYIPPANLLALSHPTGHYVFIDPGSQGSAEVRLVLLGK